MPKIFDGVFLNCDGKNLFFKNKDGHALMPVNKYHTPYCLVLCDDNISKGNHRDTTSAMISKIEKMVEEAKEDMFDAEDKPPLIYALTDEKGRLMYTNPRIYRSFHNPNIRYRCIELHTKISWKVPPVSDELFKAGIATAEFDIPYRERALIDLQADERLWMLDTGGEIFELRILAYDIETTQYDPAETQDTGGFPIDMIGWASFRIIYRAKRDHSTGKCEFEMLEMPDWEEPEIHQVVGHNLEEEIENLVMFIQLVMKHDIIAGHNITQFDNKQIYDRLIFLLDQGLIPDKYRVIVKDFVDRNSEVRRAVQAKIFFYGEMQDGIEFYPLSFDTLFASKRLFFFLPEYNLKFLAKNFGYVIKDRVYLDPIHQSIETPDEEKLTLKYNEHDVREQIGVTLHLIPEAMRLCHLNGSSFNDSMPAGTTKIWDGITFIRSHKIRKIMPPTVVAMNVCNELFHKVGIYNKKTKKPFTKKEIFDVARQDLETKGDISAKTLKAIKYGPEAPDYVRYPHLIYNPYNKSVLHVITSKGHDCKDCRNLRYLKDCKCSFCVSVRAAFPAGLDDKEDQAEFIFKQLKKAGHPESDERLMMGVNADRGWRNNNQGYHFPGGLTIHPSEVNSEFKMWWGIIVADVGAMYPSNLMAEGIGGDTVRFADPGHYEITDDGLSIKPKKNSPFRNADEIYRWTWIKRCQWDIVKNFWVALTPKELHGDPRYDNLSKEFSFVTYGYLVAIVIDKEMGGISQGMSAVLDVTAMIKKQKSDANRPDSGVSERMKTQIANAYQSMKSMRNSGTHGIITAPTVSCRQFNLAGGSRITTLGQQVLDDTMNMLDKINARFVYGDTDGIYMSCSRDARAVDDKGKKPMKEIFDLDGDGEPFIDPSLIEQTIEHINKKWQKILDYPSYELEIENHSGMMFVKHKNYLIFDHKYKDDDAVLLFKPKGNNFKAKDKPKIATSALEGIMKEIAKDHNYWENEEEEFTNMRTDIKVKSRDVVEGLDPENLDMSSFVVRQSVQPVGVYRPLEKECSLCNGKGCEYCAFTGNKLSVYGARSNAIERMLFPDGKKRLKSTVVIQCAVCNNPLPFIDKPKKSGVKPLAYMWPVDLLEKSEYKEKSGGIDWDWYKDLVFNYIKGAFGFDDWNLQPWVCVLKQMTLDGRFTIRIVSGKNFAKKGMKAQGKTMDCEREIFDKLKKGEPIPDDLMEILVTTEDIVADSTIWERDEDG